MNKPFNDIQLPIYRVPEEVKSELTSPRKIVVLSADPTTSEDQELLTKILAAAKLSQNDYHFATLEKSEAIKPLLDEGKTYICFGLPPNCLSLRIEKIPYHIFTLRNTKFLFCHKIAALHVNVNAKKALWSSLKVLFNLN